MQSCNGFVSTVVQVRHRDGTRRGANPYSFSLRGCHMSSERDQLIELFDAKVQSFEASAGRRFHSLLPFKAGIVRLREKGASSRTIADLLKQLGVTVSHNTIARFCRELPAPAAPGESRPASVKPSAANTPNPSPSTVAELLNRRHENGKAPEAPGGSRGRGPRIADPRNV